ncbi:MAG: hypothetical protein QOC60_1375 [Frankiaceae bacterium]|nr:hypothetical protein [Frankiaceae bacterium]
MTRPTEASRLTQPRIAIALCLVVLVLVGAGTALLWEGLLGTTRTQLDVARDLGGVDRLVVQLGNGSATDKAATQAEVVDVIASMTARPGSEALRPALSQLQVAAAGVDAGQGLVAYLDARANVGSLVLASASSAEAQRLTVLVSAAGLATVLGLGLVVVVVAGVRRSRRPGTEPALPAAEIGTYDRVSLARDLDAAAKRATSSGSSLACVMVDVDHFSAYTQTQGGAAGELLLGEIADIVRDAVRSKDTAYRWDETTFVLTLPDTDCGAATRLAERLRESIVRALLKEGVTISAGVAGIPSSATDADDLLAAVGSALADAQRQGRNQVRRAAVPVDELEAARDNVGRH